jgi:hypothetical protein
VVCWVEVNLKKKKTDNDAPREIINKPWQQYVVRKDGSIDFHAYTFYALKELQLALKKKGYLCHSQLALCRSTGRAN